ncbi:MAG: hypothetical protein ACR2IP_03305 [Solirubrobacteraceae bacterium]
MAALGTIRGADALKPASGLALARAPGPAGGLVLGRVLGAAGALVLACSAALAVAPPAGAYLSTRDITPFPKSSVITGASWTSPRYAPPTNQRGDILPTVWADDGNQYTMIDDGGTDVGLAHGLWKQSVARITGTPPSIQLSHVGDPTQPPPHTFAQIAKDPSIWRGPLGPYYSSGLVAANHVLYATKELNWNYNANQPFKGLQGIDYSTDNGQHWKDVDKPFPAPLGNLNWVVRGRGGSYADGYVYAIASEREFNASRLIMGRSRADVADMTDPSRWQWASGWQATVGGSFPRWSSSFAAAIPILSYQSRITYPQMAYDSPLHRYLLSFTFTYAPKPPAMWRNGADMVLLEGPHPWGPFSFVAHEPEFGPSNGYSAGFPVKWISNNGRDLWLKWAANFDGCGPHLDCSGGYGFNYRRMHLTVAGG